MGRLESFPSYQEVLFVSHSLSQIHNISMIIGQRLHPHLICGNSGKLKQDEEKISDSFGFKSLQLRITRVSFFLYFIKNMSLLQYYNNT